MSNILVDLSNSMVAAAEKAALSTVLVSARRRMHASGIAYAADLVLTADHVIEHEEGIKVMLADGTALDATLAGRDPGSDLAVLRLGKPSMTPADPQKTAHIGQLVLALGRPSEAGIEVSLGVVSAMGGPVRTPQGSLDRYLRTDTTPYPGFSGGPLVDAEGRVLGINTTGFGRGATLTIPSETAWQVAEQLVRTGSVKHGYLGVRSEAVEVPEAVMKALGRQQATGLLLVGVERKSPAEAARLMVGDILVGMEGQPVPDHDALFGHLTSGKVGKTLPTEVLRGGQLQTFQIMGRGAPMNAAALLDTALDDLLQRLSPVLVLVQNGRHGAGAGLLAGQGQVLTNLHVVGRSKSVKVLLSDDTTHDAKVIYRDPQVDLALLSLEDAPQAEAIFSARDPRPGELVYAFGHPWGLRNVLTGGVLSAVGRVRTRDGEFPILRSDVSLAPGNSGGPLLDASGEVIGLNAMIFGGDQSVSIPVSLLREFLSKARRELAAEGVL